MRPLILITNDDGVDAKGIQTLTKVACEFGEVIVMAPQTNASGLSHSIVSSRPIRAQELRREEGLTVCSCDGTPVDCVKLAVEHFCPRRPDLVLSGINHGSNSSINVLYSGTMGAAIEAVALCIPSIGFSLLNHSPQADFEPGLPYIRRIIRTTLDNRRPAGITLNVNIPRLPMGEIRGIRICHEANAYWNDSFEKRIDPQGRPYWWLTGKFVCEDPSEESDEWALAHGYVSIVPIHCDFTHHPTIEKLKPLYC
jgi:5'-nucleotidase